jgi:hypothetical protein
MFVDCGLTSSTGAAILFSFTSYTLTTSDGAHLTGTASGSAMDGGITCAFTATAVDTR